MKESISYSAFGLIWNSSDLDIPELPKIERSIKEFDVSISQDIGDDWPSIENGIYDTNTLKIAPNDLRLKIHNIASFRVTEGKRLYGKKKPHVDLEILERFGFPFGALLIQKGFLVFHGNALVKDGKAVIFLGNSGSGKSTIAYGLMKSGWKLLADDLVVLSSNGNVLPGVRRIKLWEDAVKSYKIDIEKLKDVEVI